MDIQNELKQLIRECIVANSDVRIETNDDDLIFEPKGQNLETGMINFLVENKEDIMSLFTHRNRECKKVFQTAFDHNLKRKLVVRQMPGQEDKYNVVLKGAPEFMMPLCTMTYDDQFNEVDFSEEDEK